MGRKLKNAPTPHTKQRDYGTEITSLMDKAHGDLSVPRNELRDLLNDVINHGHILLDALESTDEPPDEDDED